MLTNVLAIPEVALALSLFGAPVLLLVIKRSGGSSLGLPFRLSLWVLAGIALEAARSATPGAQAAIGMLPPTWHSAMGAAVAVVMTLAAWPLAQRLHVCAGAKSTIQGDAFREIVAQPLRYRLFLIVTAAVTEEILYRGFAIGMGAQMLGSPRFPCQK